MLLCTLVNSYAYIYVHMLCRHTLDQGKNAVFIINNILTNLNID